MRVEGGLAAGLGELQGLELVRPAAARDAGAGDPRARGRECRARTRVTAPVAVAQIGGQRNLPVRGSDRDRDPPAAGGQRSARASATAPRGVSRRASARQRRRPVPAAPIPEQSASAAAGTPSAVTSIELPDRVSAASVRRTANTRAPGPASVRHRAGDGRLQRAREARRRADAGIEADRLGGLVRARALKGRAVAEGEPGQSDADRDERQRHRRRPRAGARAPTSARRAGSGPRRAQPLAGTEQPRRRRGRRARPPPGRRAARPAGPARRRSRCRRSAPGPARPPPPAPSAVADGRPVEQQHGGDHRDGDQPPAGQRGRARRASAGCARAPGPRAAPACPASTATAPTPDCGAGQQRDRRQPGRLGQREREQLARPCAGGAQPVALGPLIAAQPVGGTGSRTPPARPARRRRSAAAGEGRWRRAPRRRAARRGEW